MSAPVAPSRIRQCLRCRLDRCPQALGYGSYHIIRRQGPPDPLQLELTNRLDLHGVLDLRQHSRADQNLPRLGFIAKARGHVRHRPDGGIIEAPLITNGAERSKAVRNPDAEANVVPEAAPRFASKLRWRHALQAPSAQPGAPGSRLALDR